MNRNRMWSLGLVAFFCLLCLGTSTAPPPPTPTTGPVAMPWAQSSAPTMIGHNTRVNGRLDPLDPKTEDGTGHYDAYVVTLVKGKTYQVRVRDPNSSAPPADAGIGGTWFSVRIMTGTVVAPANTITIEEKAHEGGGTIATFTPAVEGEHTITVSAHFKREGVTHPGFASYEVMLVPL